MAKIRIERYKKKMKEHEKVLKESDQRIEKIRETGYLVIAQDLSKRQVAVCLEEIVISFH